MKHSFPISITILFLLSLLTSGYAFCQPYVEQAVKNWNTFMREDLERLKEDAFETLRRGIDEKNEYAVAVGMRSLGTYLSRTGKSSQSLRYLEDAGTWFQKEGDRQLAAETLNELGNAYLLADRPSKARKTYLSSIEVGVKSSDPTAAFLAEVNLAQACLTLKDTTAATALAHDYKRKSAYYHKWEAVANAYAILGKIAQGKGQNDLSVEYFQKSAYFGLRSSAYLIRAQALTNLAIVRYADGINGQAEKLFLQALLLRKKHGAPKAACESMFNLAVFYEMNGEITKAEKWYQTAIDFSVENNFGSELKDASIALSDFYENQGDLSASKQVLRNLVNQLEEVWRFNEVSDELESKQLEGLEEYVQSHPFLMNNAESGQKVDIRYFMVLIILGIPGIILLTLYARRKGSLKIN